MKVKHTSFKNRNGASKQDDEISWIKGYNHALKDILKVEL